MPYKKLKMSKPVKNIFTEEAIHTTFIADSIAKHATKKDIGAHSIFLGQGRVDVIKKTLATIE